MANAIEQRKSLLVKSHCGITDIIASCERSQNNASDSNLTNIQYQPLLEYLQKYPTIKTLIYTSLFVQIQVYRYFTQTFQHNWKKEKLDNYKRAYRLYFPDAFVLEDITLYSPSPQALKGLGKNGKQKRLEQYRIVFS